MAHDCCSCIENCPYKSLLEKLSGGFEESGVNAFISCSSMPNPLFKVQIGRGPYVIDPAKMQVVRGNATRTYIHNEVLFRVLAEMKGEEDKRNPWKPNPEDKNSFAYRISEAAARGELAVVI